MVQGPITLMNDGARVPHATGRPDKTSNFIIFNSYLTAKEVHVDFIFDIKFIVSLKGLGFCACLFLSLPNTGR